jgi:ATP-dependent helicase HrpB
MKARIDFLHRRMEAEEWPEISDDKLLDALEGFIDGVSKWKDLEKVDLTAVMDCILARFGHDRRELDRLAPVKMAVPSGSLMTIKYEGDEPTVQVRLQECFGLMETPKVAGGKVPVVMTLLSPAQRPVQVTRDLEGFWKGAYQLVRKDMRGRYPKHYWPEDPFTAVATSRVRPDAERR